MSTQQRLAPAAIIVFMLFPGCFSFSPPFLKNSLASQRWQRSHRIHSRRWPQFKTTSTCVAGVCSLQMVVTRRSILSAAFFLSPPLVFPGRVVSVEDIVLDSTEEQGWAPITKSSIGKSIRYSAVRGARTFDQLDELWARFSDSLRDEKKCDPVTNRRLFDNGVRRDGTRVGDPVVGDLCDPVEIRPINDDVSRMILSSSLVAFNSLNNAMVENSDIEQAIQKITNLVRPSFERSQKGIVLNEEDANKRQNLNLALYVQMRAFSEQLEKALLNGSEKKRLSQVFESSWGDKLAKELAPRADRNDFKSPLPPFQLADSLYPYNTGKLLDALGVVSVGLQSLQNSGHIGYWEIIIPPDDNGDVVTIAVDNDTTLPVQILLQEQRKIFRGSPVTALVAAAMKNSLISYNIDTFFIDPSTTNQDKYNPTQLLLSLSALSGAKE